MNRALLALLVTNLILSLTALGWLAWITAEPRHWFADAYAAKGPTGERAHADRLAGRAGRARLGRTRKARSTTLTRA
jgi:hypothetical protein